MIQVVRYQGPLIGCAVIIFVLSSLPQVARLPLPYHLDKLVHAIVYGVLAWAAHRAFYHQDWWDGGRRHAIKLALVFALVYGLTDEYHQQFVPGRVSSLLDLGADAIGATVAMVVMSWKKRWQGTRAARD